MLDFFNKFFKPAPPSSATAKERLRLVLLSDHLSLSPDVVDLLKRDLFAVISRYVEIDSANADVSFEQRESEVAMLANIPITAVRPRTYEPLPAPYVVPPVTPQPAPAHRAASAAPEAEPLELPHVTGPDGPAGFAVQRDGQAKPSAAAQRRRRRRRKANAAKRNAQQQDSVPMNAPAQA